MAAITDNFDRKDVAVMAVEAGIALFLIPVPVTDSATLQELHLPCDIARLQRAERPQWGSIKQNIPEVIP